ncbi:MAG: bisanhydrobacterioruberin hydratase [Halodesulfurarchaeum sp.]|nr:bisanhydrobacterioruberin hydratase [Halodesulfurarchaeum sp.]
MDRRAIETRLETTVADNRFTIAVVFPTVGALLLIGSAEGWVPAPLSFEPTLILFGTAVMRLPLIAGVLPLLDRRGTIGLLALTGYAYGIELVGVRTGLPYGEFDYLIDLGPMLFGDVPLGLPIFFLPLVLNSYLLVVLLLGSRATATRLRLGGTLAMVMAMDLVLDPGAVGLGFWGYVDGGGYYGVPVSNFAGWLLSGAISVWVFDRMLVRERVLERLATCRFMLDDLISFVILWGGVNLYFGQWLPVAVAVLIGVGLLRTERFDFDVSPRLLDRRFDRR